MLLSTQKLIFIIPKIAVKFEGIWLKQDNVSFTYRNIVFLFFLNECIVWIEWMNWMKWINWMIVYECTVT